MNGLNFMNQNQILFGGNSVNHQLSGGARISGISGEESVQTAPGGVMSYTNTHGVNSNNTQKRNMNSGINFQD